MLTFQQLIKVLRQLQSSVSTNSSSDLVKTLKQVAAATTTTTEFIMPAIASTACSAQKMTSSTTSSSSSKSPQQPQQTSNSSQQQATAYVESQTNHDTEEASLTLHLNESSLSQQTTDVSTTQDKYKIATTTSQTSQYLQRSQQIQNFYQQQLHHFHTQHNRSDYAKQQQIQFSMSSLAAEPLALKQDDIVVNLNGSTSDNKSNVSVSSTTSSANNQQKCGSSAASGQPCFNTGLAEILQFMELIGNLKHTKRTGWVLRDVNDCESISGHMYRMSMMTFLLDGSEGLNQIRCMELALVHDLAESLVGDITPFCGVSKQDKRTMEFKAMDDICKLIEPRGKRIMELFQEYEHGESAESKFVKDLDRLDMVMQAYEYEKRDNCLLKHQEFFDSTEGKFNHPFVKKLVAEIYEQRKVLAKHKGALAPPSIKVPNMDLPPQITANGHCATPVLTTTTLPQQQKQQDSTPTSPSS